MEDPSIITVMIMVSLFSVIGTIGNSLVLYIYFNKKTKSTARIFIKSLAGTDLFTCLFVMPFQEAFEYLTRDLKYDIVCKIYVLFVTCSITFATFIMCAIAIDRYFKICHPFWHVLTIYRAKIIVACLLVLASTFGIIKAIACGQVNIFKLYKRNQNGSHSHVPVDFIYSTETSLTLNLTKLYEANSSLINQNQDNASSNYEIFRYSMCTTNGIHISEEFYNAFDRVFAGTYLLAFIVVFVLYTFIFRSIHKHRVQLSKWKRSSQHPSEIANVGTKCNAVTNEDPCNLHRALESLENGEAAIGEEERLPKVDQIRPPAKSNRHVMSINQNTLIADIRTMMMLFVVAIVFLIAFLPALLMSLNLLRYNMVIFNMYFIYNMTNQFIYTFMDKSFRDDLRNVIKCQSMTSVR